ncbi:TetR/AcrR family transcriptional regulator [Bacillus sp. SD088]|uniref:TetR/AcrR family transcriptional regulator n=1 Tax=Bacillus sp. SD088 TaxID=2782012 RepID=UPI001A9730EC|nr:TetR/AcrR family transcriptional regulator [Bacillus sp. SD088]MBO0992978.1 TetR/AcrR family transcriptional regulator [Bacillus sp. SD088]
MRPIKYSDEQIFLGFYTAISIHGYSNLSLEKIAKEANVSTAILSKRFGSKKGLVISYFQYALEQTRLVVIENQREEANIETLRNFLMYWSARSGDAASLASMIAIYLEGVRDKELRAISKERGLLIDNEVQRILQNCIDNGEIPVMDVKEASFLLQASTLGAVMLWLNNQDKNPNELVECSINRIIGMK